MAKQVGIDAGNEAVLEFGIGKAMLLAEQDDFGHGKQGIGEMIVVVSRR